MGWKGAVRSVGVAVRAAERDAKQRQRELERKQKQYEKMQELEQAAYEVDVYKNHIDVIQSIHKECSSTINWNDIASSQKPRQPNKITNNEKDARLNADLYRPGLLDRIFKRKEKKRELFIQKIVDAVKIDGTQNESIIVSWEKEVEDWKKSVEIAKALMQGDSESKIEAIEKLQPFSEISNLGSNLSILINDTGLLEVMINVHSADIVPSEIRSLLANGKLSVRNMPKGRFNEIYQDYVCSCVLRVANELFSIIPDKIVIVTAVDELLDSKTGHLVEAPILSIAASRSTLENLNLEAIDPSDSMSNFVHNMSFKKTKGFNRVERVDISNLDCT